MTSPPTSPRSATTCRAWSPTRGSSSTMCASSAARSRRRASTTSKVCSSGSATPSTRSAPSASCSTRSRRCSRASPNERDPARRVAPPVRLAQGPRRHGGDHGRARRWAAHAARAGGIRLRLRHPARQPGRRPDHHAAAARRQVSRLGARHQRIPLPRSTSSGISVLPVTSAGLGHDTSERRRVERHRRDRRHARRRRLSTADRACSSRARPAPARPSSPRTSRMRRAGAANAASTSPSRNRPTRSCETCARSAIDLGRHVDAGLLRFEAARPSLYGLEMHLTLMHARGRALRARRGRHRSDLGLSRPDASRFIPRCMRMVDLLKVRGITALVHEPDLGGPGAGTKPNTACPP